MLAEALIRDDSPYRQTWLEIFVGPRAPIHDGDPVDGCYHVDMERLTPKQKQNLLRHLSQRHKTPVDVIERDLAAAGGAEIPEADVAVQYVLA